MGDIKPDNKIKKVCMYIYTYICNSNAHIRQYILYIYIYYNNSKNKLYTYIAEWSKYE